MRWALVAAIVATLGDFLMLGVANALDPGLELSQPPAFALALGAVLGVIAIPIYALGYRAIARLLTPVSRRRAQTVLTCGTAGSLLGAFIHGWTGLVIHQTVASGAASTTSFFSMLASGGVLTLAWSAAAAFVLAASVAMASPRVLRAAGLPTALVLFNPCVVTLVLAVIGLPWELARAFWTPAAPNVAHIICFGAWLHQSGGRAGPDKTGA